MKIALGQINPTVGDFSGNSRKIIEFANRARAAGAELIVFSEMCVCGYPARDMVERPAFVRRNQETVEKIAEATRGIAVLCGFVTPAKAETGKSVMNSAALLADGKIQFQQSKMLLPTYDVFDEQRNFAPAEKQELVRFGDRNVALTICEDAWNDKHFWPRRLYSVDPVETLIKAGGDFVVNMSASPFHIGKPQLREDMLTTIARTDNVPVLFVNQVGGNDSVVIDGSSMVIAPNGEIVARAKSFEEDLIYYDTQAGKGDVHPQLHGREESAYHALVLGTRDYVQKTGFGQAILGLSGGIDSALVAAIAVDALGANNVIGFGMPSDYSSQHSLDDAKALADALGINYSVIPIKDMFATFRKTLAPEFKGMPEDITEENMQSRI
ncbi:MAG TPA: NAD(+) synthase, partial [Terriglobales bacterium]|nr:NAD(+) synthase [Terriglobales bacterium]